MEKINVAELLKDCPSGMELDCTMYENVYFDEICDDEDCLYPIRCYIIVDGVRNPFYLTKYGDFNTMRIAKCVIFPKGKTTWEGFQRPIENGDIVAFDSKFGTQIFLFKEYIYDHNYAQCYMMLNSNGDIDFESRGYLVQRFATKEEKQKLFKAIKEHGYRWNPETKTLEKLIEPKFKVGDRIRRKNSNEECIIISINDYTYYYRLNEHCTGSLEIQLQDDYELVPNKFDISTLVPFESRVLVRNDESQYWKPAFWGCKHSDGYITTFGYGYINTYGCCKYCIPYEGNEHLLGTNDNCDEYFNTWV